MTQSFGQLSDKDDTWTGQFPVTLYVLTAMRGKLDAVGTAGLTADEWFLLTVCEFWQASSRGELHAFLGNDPPQRLRLAIAAFSRIGARRVVSSLRMLHETLERTTTSAAVRESVRLLHDQLAATDDDVEGLIASLAGTLIDHETA